VIVADAKRVVMENDFKSALVALVGKLPDANGEDTTPFPTDPTRQQQIEDVRQDIEDIQRTLDQLKQSLEEILESIE